MAVASPGALHGRLERARGASSRVINIYRTCRTHYYGLRGLWRLLACGFDLSMSLDFKFNDFCACGTRASCSWRTALNVFMRAQADNVFGWGCAADGRWVNLLKRVPANAVPYRVSWSNGWFIHAYVRLVRSGGVSVGTGAGNVFVAPGQGARPVPGLHRPTCLTTTTGFHFAACIGSPME